VSQFKKHIPSGNMIFTNLGIFQSLKVRSLMEKIVPISLKLNFTPNILDCCGLISGSCHKRQKAQAPTPQEPIRNRQTRKVANAKVRYRYPNLT